MAETNEAPESEGKPVELKDELADLTAGAYVTY